MSVQEMRDLLGLGPEFTDAQVAEAYAAYLAGGQVAGDGAPVVTLEEVKEHLRVRHDREDGNLTIYLAAAIADLDGAEGWLGRALVERTYVKTFDDTTGVLRLPYPPIVSISAVEIRAPDGTWSSLAAGSWALDGRNVTPAVGTAWPDNSGLRVTYRAGYDPSAGRPLPFNIRAAILLMVGDLYENRATSDAPRSSTAERLLRPAQVFA